MIMSTMTPLPHLPTRQNAAVATADTEIAPTPLPTGQVGHLNTTQELAALPAVHLPTPMSRSFRRGSIGTAAQSI